MIQTSVAVAVFIALILTTAAQPTPQPKVGACPSGYRESGGYCAPMSRRAGRNPEDRPMSIWVHAIGRVLP